MITDATRARFDKEVAKYPSDQKQSAVMACLAIVQQEQGWISRGYGHREAASVLVYSVRATVPLTLRTDLVLVPSGTPASVARSLVGR